MRPRIWPCSISLKMALISSSGRIVAFGTTLPSAADWNASCRILTRYQPASRPPGLPSAPDGDIKAHGFRRQANGHHAATGTASTAELNAAFATAVTSPHARRRFFLHDFSGIFAAGVDG